MEEYAYAETRYKMLTKAHPEAAKTLMEFAKKDAKFRWNFYEQLAKMDFSPKAAAPAEPKTE